MVCQPLSKRSLFSSSLFLDPELTTASFAPGCCACVVGSFSSVMMSNSSNIANVEFFASLEELVFCFVVSIFNVLVLSWKRASFSVFVAHFVSSLNFVFSCFVSVTDSLPFPCSLFSPRFVLLSFSRFVSISNLVTKSSSVSFSVTSSSSEDW